MKRIMVIMLALGLAMGASAQRYYGHGYGGGHIYVAPRRVIVGTYSPFYSPYGYYPYGYNPYGDIYTHPYRPSKLELQVEDIRKDYEDRIRSARHDKSISRHERKAVVRQLKAERDQTIDDTKRNYYRQ